MNKLLYILFLLSAGLAFSQSAPELTNNLATNIDAADERQAWREALELWTDDSPTFTGGTYTGNLLVSGKLNVGNGSLDDTHIVNIVSAEDVATEVMLHLEWNSPTPAAGDSNALLFSMYDSALNETEYARFRSVIEDPTDGTEDGAMTVDVLNDGVLEQAVLFSHDEIIMNDNGADRNFIVKDSTTAEVFRITGGNGSIAMDGSTLFVDSANNRVGIGTATPSQALEVAGQVKFDGGVDVAIASPSYYRGDVYIGRNRAGAATVADLIMQNGEIQFASNSGTWNGATISGDQSFSGNVDITGVLTTGGGVNLDSSGYFIRRSAGSPLGASQVWTNTVFGFDMMEMDLLNRQVKFLDGDFIIYENTGFAVNNNNLFFDGTSQLFLGQGTGTAGSLHLRDGSSHHLKLIPSAFSATRTYTIPDVNSNADFVLTAGDQTIAGNKTFSGDLTVDTDTLVVDASANTTSIKNLDIGENIFGIVGGSSVQDFRYPINSGFRAAASGSTTYSDGAGFQIFGGTSSLAGNMYYDFGSSQRTLGSASVNFRYMNTGGSFSTKLKIDSGGPEIGTGSNLSFSSNSGTWDGATIAGDQTMSGQIELTGQAASTDDSAMTRSLVRQDLFDVDVIKIEPLGWGATFVGTGAISESVSSFRTNTGTTTGSSSHLRANKDTRIMLGANGGAFNVIPWGSRIRVKIVIGTLNPDANTVLRFQVGETYTDTSVKDLDKKGFGFKITNTSIALLAHDGSSLTTAASVGTLGNLVRQTFVLDSDGSGNVSLYAGGSLLSTTTGGPTSNGTANDTAFNLSITNGAGTSNFFGYVTGPIYYQIGN